MGPSGANANAKHGGKKRSIEERCASAFPDANSWSGRQQTMNVEAESYSAPAGKAIREKGDGPNSTPKSKETWREAWQIDQSKVLDISFMEERESQTMIST